MALEVCRICGGNTELINILYQGPEIIEKLEECANIQVLREDSLPHFICQQCNQHLDLSYKLRKQSEETASRLKKEMKIRNQPDVEETPSESKLETATSSLLCNEEIKINQQYASISSSKQSATETSVKSSGSNVCKKENKPIHIKLKIERSNIDEEEFQMIDNSNPELINDSYEVYGLLEAHPPSIAPAKNDIKIEEVRLIPPDQISMDGNDAAESQNYLKMQQNATNDMFIEGNNIGYLNSNYVTNPETSPSESTSYVDNDGNNDISPSSDFDTEDCENLNLASHSKSYCETGDLSPKLLTETADPNSDEWKRTCNICYKRFTQIDDRKRHMELHSKEGSYKCTTCLNSFKSLGHLNNHVTKFHQESDIHEQNSTTQRWTRGVNIPKKNQCNFCGKQLHSPSSHYTHIKRIHTNEKSPYVCKICNEEYYTPKSLNRHEQLDHPSGNKRPYKCDICFKYFKILSELTRHELVHLPPQYSCSLCPSTFRYKQNFNTHKRIHANEKLFKCVICSEEFIHKNSLDRHTSKIHSDNTAEKDESESINKDNRLEDSPISSSGTFKNDLLIKTSNKPQWIPGVNIPKENQCDYCGHQLTTSLIYQKHIQNLHSHAEPLYKCKTCNKTYLTLSSLNIHESRQHSRNEISPYKCDICPNSFKNLAQLRRHVLVHSDRPLQHSCPICPAKFRHKGNLNIHMLIHTKEKPLNCNMCSEEFVHPDLLKRHTEKMHSDTTTSGNISPLEIDGFHPEVNPPHKCENCNKEFLTRKILTRHKSRRHCSRFHKCHICSLSFIQSSHLKQHLLSHSDLPKKVHPDSLEPLEIINKSEFINKDDRLKDSLSSFEEFVHTVSLEEHTKKIHSDNTAASENVKPLEKDELINNDDRLEGTPTSSDMHTLKEDIAKLGDLPPQHSCSICPAKFKHKGNFDSHMRIHSNEKQNLLIHTNNKNSWTPGVNIPEKNQCDYCGKQLKSYSTYKNHIQNKHPNEKPPYVCKACNEGFFSLYILNQHEGLKHSGIDRPYKCDICLKSFKHLSRLKIHIVSHSNLPPQHSCSICSTKFRHKCNFYAHMRLHSKESADLDSLKRHTKKLHSNTNAFGNIKPPKVEESKLVNVNRLEHDCSETSEYESNMLVDFPEESQQQLPSTPKQQFRNSECSINPQNILKNASNSTSTTESNLIEFVKVEKYQITEQNVEELKTDKPKLSTIYNIEDFI